MKNKDKNYLTFTFLNASNLALWWLQTNVRLSNVDLECATKPHAKGGDPLNALMDQTPFFLSSSFVVFY